MKNSFIRKHIFLFSNLAIILFIVFGFIGVLYKDTKTYQDLAETDLKNIVSLADLNIEKIIENTMSSPVTVSKTMANDVFLKDWMLKETDHKNDANYLTQLYNYLTAYQRKYGYSTVFCISAQTGHYYYQGGLNKTISPQDSHDIWYYNFVNSGQEYDLEVDTSEEDNNNITIFVNFRLEDAGGKLLGIIGVGLQVNFLENLIRFYEREYGLSVYIINSSDVKTSFTGKTSIFINKNQLKERIGSTDSIILNKTEKSQIQWFTVNGTLKCLTTKYNNTLGWYLIVEKDTATINNAFQERIKNNILFMLISLVACILVITIIFINYNQMIIVNENKDEITGLSNRKLFLKQAPAFAHKNREQSMSLFILDIDNFKHINDTYGHIFGNVILAMIGENLNSTVHEYGMTARWGGDEFIGILALDTQAAKQLLTQLMVNLKNGGKEGHTCITFSAGIVSINQKQNIKQTFEQADKALYCSKESGKDQITVCD